LLERLRPRIAVIEVGAHNPFGHPHPSTLAALRAAGPTVLRTDRDGDVSMTLEHGRMALERGR
jgi:competence protein ComEC